MLQISMSKIDIFSFTADSTPLVPAVPTVPRRICVYVFKIFFSFQSSNYAYALTTRLYYLPDYIEHGDHDRVGAFFNWAVAAETL